MHSFTDCSSRGRSSEWAMCRACSQNHPLSSEESVNCFTAAIWRILAFTSLYKGNSQGCKNDKSIILGPFPDFRVRSVKELWGDLFRNYVATLAQMGSRGWEHEIWASHDTNWKLAVPQLKLYKAAALVRARVKSYGIWGRQRGKTK